MSTQRILFLLSLLFTFAPVFLPAQEEATLYEYQRRTEVVAHNVVNLVMPHLPSQEASVVAASNIRVEPTWLTNAYARRRSDGSRQIVFGAGLAAYLEQIADAYVTEHSGHRPGCTQDYLSYLAPPLVENTHRVQRGLAPHGVAMFYTFALTTGGHCRDASPVLLQNPEVGRIFAHIMDASVAFAVLHELGHEVRGHVDAHTDDLEIHRKQEADADSWAIFTALQSGYDLRSAVPWFLLEAAIGGDTIEDERHNDHPLGGRRVLDALRQSRAILYATDPTSAALFDETIRQLEKEIPSN